MLHDDAFVSCDGAHSDFRDHDCEDPLRQQDVLAADALDQLLVQAGLRDQRAFRRLYDATSSKLLAQALSMLRRRDAAEDALQDAYVRIWTRAGDYEPHKGRAIAWMVRVLRNVIIDRLRRERMMQRYHAPEDAGGEMAVPPEPVELRIDLMDGLAHLSAEQRNAIVTVVVQGWTHDEAGRQGNVPTPTSKARVLRGLRKLKNLYTSGDLASHGYQLGQGRR